MGVLWKTRAIEGFLLHVVWIPESKCLGNQNFLFGSIGYDMRAPLCVRAHTHVTLMAGQIAQILRIKSD